MHFMSQDSHIRKEMRVQRDESLAVRLYSIKIKVTQMWDREICSRRERLRGGQRSGQKGVKEASVLVQ